MEFNRLTGTIPATMIFGTYDLAGLIVANNNLSGRRQARPVGSSGWLHQALVAATPICRILMHACLSWLSRPHRSTAILAGRASVAARDPTRQHRALRTGKLPAGRPAWMQLGMRMHVLPNLARAGRCMLQLDRALADGCMCATMLQVPTAPVVVRYVGDNQQVHFCPANGCSFDLQAWPRAL